MQHFTFPAYSEKDIPQCTLKVNGTKPWGIQIGPFAVHETYLFNFVGLVGLAGCLGTVEVGEANNLEGV